jgi:hypothetical protein
MTENKRELGQLYGPGFLNFSNYKPPLANAQNKGRPHLYSLNGVPILNTLSTESLSTSDSYKSNTESNGYNKQEELFNGIKRRVNRTVNRNINSSQYDEFVNSNLRETKRMTASGTNSEKSNRYSNNNIPSSNVLGPIRNPRAFKRRQTRRASLRASRPTPKKTKKKYHGPMTRRKLTFNNANSEYDNMPF